MQGVAFDEGCGEIAGLVLMANIKNDRSTYMRRAALSAAPRAGPKTIADATPASDRLDFLSASIDEDFYVDFRPKKMRGASKP